MTDKDLKFLDFILIYLSKIYPNHKSISDLDRMYAKSNGTKKQNYLVLKDFVKKYDYEYFEKVTPLYAIKITNEWNEKIEIHGSLIKFFEFKKVVNIINESTVNDINLKYITDKIDINTNRVNEIFKILIENDVVHNVSSKKGIEISKKEFIDYDLSLFTDLSKPININVNAVPSNNPVRKSLFKRIVTSPWFIGIVLVIIAAILNADRISDWINNIINNIDLKFKD